MIQHTYAKVSSGFRGPEDKRLCIGAKVDSEAESGCSSILTEDLLQEEHYEPKEHANELLFEDITLILTKVVEGILVLGYLPCEIDQVDKVRVSHHIEEPSIPSYHQSCKRSDLRC